MGDMYDISRLKTAAECRTVMARAKERGLDDVYKSAFRRHCALIGSGHEDPSDPLVKDFYEMLAAYEQILAERHGRNQLAQYTRRAVNNKGIHQTLIDWARKKGETPGFKALIEAGLAELTGEYIVLKHAERFPQDAVALARTRLTSHGVALPA